MIKNLSYHSQTFSGEDRWQARSTSNVLPIRMGLCCGVLVLSGWAEEPQIEESQMPRIPAIEPIDAMDTFDVRPGFRIELVAHEPDVVDPIAMAFDEEGALYVIEMRGYSERRDEGLGRIRYLRDEDGDGFYESSTVFKDGLKWPTGIVCYKGGVFVGATPEIRYFKDTDDDGVSDEERLVFTGFGPSGDRLNMQALFNSFRWGPDNRVWGATAASGGLVVNPNNPSSSAVSVRGADFSFDPETLDFRPENGTAQYGMTFDSIGRRFVCSNSRHLIWIAYERNQLLESPFFDMPSPLVDIPIDGAAAAVFRISPDEPWRVVRTRWRVSGVVRGMVEGGGRVSGYFTSASGIHAYWGGAYGNAFRDNVFIGDVGSNLVHRKILRQEDGKVQPVSIRPEDEQGTEFLRSHDNWFRPASFATGPDGCLYICDMYRETIEHPWSLPPGIKKHLDLDSGNDRGRIYRIEPEGFERPEIPKLSTLSDRELQAIAHQSKDDWAQTTARRLLFEREKPVSSKPSSFPFPALLESEDGLVERLPEWQGDPWLEAMILNSLRTEESIGDALNNSWSAASPRFKAELVGLSGRSGSESLIEVAISKLAEVAVSNELVRLVSALKEGILFAGGDWDGTRESEGLRVVFTRAKAICEDESIGEVGRLAALRILKHEGSPSSDLTRMRIATHALTPPALAVEAVEGMEDPSLLLDRLDRLPAELIRNVTSRMSETSETALRLLEAISAQKLGIEMLTAVAMQNIRQSKDPGVAEKARAILPKAETRSSVIADYQQALEPLGDPVSGKVVFNKVCIACHQTTEGEGQLFGPPVATFKNAGRESILGNILDPNKEVAPQYQAFQFSLRSGDTFVGMIASENERSVTVSLPSGVAKTFSRTEVERMTGVGRSLMPEGMEDVLSVREMSDLLAYLSQ